MRWNPTVTEKGIVDAMRLIWERMKIIIEPSSAVPMQQLWSILSILKGNGLVLLFRG